MLALPAEGNIEAAAQLSNAPERRYEVLQDYRARVGEEEFKRVYARYFAPGKPHPQRRELERVLKEYRKD